MDSAHVEEWHGEDVSIDEVQRQLCALRTTNGEADLRTSVMTHTAWVPRQWVDAARGTLAGLAEAHPSRTIALIPDPEAGRDAIDATVSVYRFDLPGETRRIYTEVVELHLLGVRASSPASIIEPLLISDLPVFSRWRGRPTFDSPEFHQLAGVVDRMIVDSGEWDDVPGAYAELAQHFESAAFSDIAFRRSQRWRATVAEMWPDISGAKKVTVTGPKADTLLLAGWLRSRLDRPDIELEHEDAETLKGVALDGAAVPLPSGDPPLPSDVLSEELERFTPDPVYEASVLATS
jgi:glucose-6-phosphate dehydrogenase assembly protein OpcA